MYIKSGLLLLILLINATVLYAQSTDSLKYIPSSVSEADFNTVKKVSLFQLIQSQVPGFTYYRNSGDPNAKQNVQVRGLNSFSNNIPIYLDGIPIHSDQLVDANDIESIEVIKDIASVAIAGNRARNGAIQITSKSASSDPENLVQVHYSYEFAISERAGKVDVLDREGFLAIGGNDLGGDTDWQDEITRTGYSNHQNLAVSGTKDQTQYFLSMNLQGVDGVLFKSGYDQRNFRIGLDQSLLNEKLSLSANLISNDRDSDLSFKEAFEYAVTMNPTAPIIGSESNIGNSDFYAPYRGFFHPVGLFDSSNPYAMIALNSNISEATDLYFAGDASYKINDQLSIEAAYSNQSLKVDNFEFYSIYDAYRGGAGTSSPGLARKRTSDVSQSYLSFVSNYSGFSSDINYNFSLGYNVQNHEFDESQVEIRGFENDSELTNIFNANYESNGQLILQSNADPSETISNVYLKGGLKKPSSFLLDFAIHAQSASFFRDKNKTNIFPSIKGGLFLTDRINIEAIEKLAVTLGFGTSGIIPTEFGVRNNFYVGGNTVRIATNPDLEIEKTSELNLAIDFSTNRLSSRLEFYQRDVRDLIFERSVDPAVFGQRTRFENFGSLRTRGVELSLTYNVVESEKFEFVTTVILSNYKTTIDDIGINQFLTGSPGAPGQGSTQMIRVAEGQELGQFWGPVYSGSVDANGVPIMEDLNGDGVVQTNQALALTENADFKVLGNSNPDLELGWMNELNVQRFNFRFMFQGAFGHSLINLNRMFYEPRIVSMNSYNNVDSEFANDDLRFARFSSHYVEKADFLRLQYIDLGYSFSTTSIPYVNNLRASFILENVFTLTNYTGANPEPVMDDYGSTDSGGYEDNFPNSYNSGIDRRNRYLPERSILFGIKIGF